MPITVDPDNYDVSYNGFEFDGAMTETVRIDSQAKYDEAGRTIIYIVYVLTLRSVIYADVGSTTDNSMDNIRQRLHSPGGALRYSDRGFGGFEINVGQREMDVVWGPKPQILSWEPWGDANAAQIEWSVEVAIPECDAAHFEGHAMEYGFRIDYVIDADGFTTRKISGHITIPQTRDGQANRKLKHSADEYRDKIKPRTPEGFRPLPKSFSLSLDKCRLDFSFTDEEMGNNIPPPGCLRCDADMSSMNNGQFGFLQHFYTISATYYLHRGARAGIAAEAFKRLVDSRQAAIRKQIDKKVGLIPVSTKTADPKIYGKIKECSFSITFTATFRQQDLLLVHGFWEPVPDSDWQKWKAPLDKVIFNARGQAGLKFDPKSELIIDLCQADVAQQDKKLIDNRLGNRPHVEFFLNPRKLKPLPAPPTWIVYKQSFRFVQIDEPILHKPHVPPPRRSPGNPDSTFMNYPEDLSLHQENTSVTGTRTQPTYYLIVEGFAMRAGAPIVPPVVLALGPFPLVPANRACDGFVQFQHPCMGDTNVWVAHWRFRLLVPTSVPPIAAGPNATHDEEKKLRESIRGWDVKFKQNQKELEESLRGGAASGGLPPF